MREEKTQNDQFYQHFKVQNLSKMSSFDLCWQHVTWVLAPCYVQHWQVTIIITFTHSIVLFFLCSTNIHWTLYYMMGIERNGMWYLHFISSHGTDYSKQNFKISKIIYTYCIISFRTQTGSVNTGYINPITVLISKNICRCN